MALFVLKMLFTITYFQEINDICRLNPWCIGVSGLSLSLSWAGNTTSIWTPWTIQRGRISDQIYSWWTVEYSDHKQRCFGFFWIKIVAYVSSLSAPNTLWGSVFRYTDQTHNPKPLIAEGSSEASPLSTLGPTWCPMWTQLLPTVDRRNPANQLRLVVYLPLFTGCFTSQVVVWDFFHQQYVT